MTPANHLDPDAYARRLAAESLAGGDVTGWFERLYVDAEYGTTAVPWDRGGPHPLFAQWAATRAGSGSALVVGCGLGEDAEYVARLGYATTAFDVSPAAIRAARRRFPDSPVDYQVADLLAPPASWRRAFDLVVECLTVQALPGPQRHTAIERIASMVAPAGVLVVVAAAAPAEPPEPTEPPGPADPPDPAGQPARTGPAGTPDPDGRDEGPPWPLTAAEIAAFATDGLQRVRIEHIQDAARPDVRRWRAEFRRPAATDPPENPGTEGRDRGGMTG